MRRMNATTPTPSHPLTTGARSLLVFAGSTRARSWNRTLARNAAAIGERLGARVTLLELGEFELPLYNADLEASGTPDAALRLKAVLHAHPAWVICSPEYNGSYTGLLKNTLDWASSPVKGHPQWGASGILPFEGKVVGLLSASPGALGGLRSLMQLAPLLRNLQCWVAPRQFALSKAHEAFDAQGQLLRDADHHQVSRVLQQTLHAADAFIKMTPSA
jgi:chromate reductase, NAD(P)H dehydrogenase (quinone)